MLTALFSQSASAGWRILAGASLLFFLSSQLAQAAQDSPAANPSNAVSAPAKAQAPAAAKPAAPTQPPPPPAPATPQAQAIQALIKSGTLPKLRYGRFSDHQAHLETLYQSSGYAPLWTQAGKATAQAQKTIASLATADEKGLNSADYDAEWLRKAFDGVTTANAQDAAAFDVALSLSLMRYASNLYMGRINPRQVNFNLDIAPKKMDLPALLHKLAANDKPDALLDGLEPKLKLYEYLKRALAQYRQLAADNPTVSIKLPDKFKPGSRHADVPTLRKFLATVGDLTEGNTADTSPVYDPALVAAVKRFQARHGLTVDGIIGKPTLTQLNVPLAERVTQIQLGLERLRWLPEHIKGRHLIANVPSFQLFGYHTGAEQDRPDLEMNVIVGEAIDGRNTPVFHSDMTYVNFRPYWNVPDTIIAKEYVPVLRRNPAYLNKQNMELVTNYALDAKPHAATRENVERLASGSLKLRQKPGPKNALGLVKFTFPNTNNVYLHSTPSQSLFKRTRRDFSHGCIRVELPVKLAEFVLKDEVEWKQQKIEEAMHGDATKIVTLKTPIPVYIFYSTVLADADGRAMFYQDLYGHDAILAEQLAKGFPYPK
ncbi:MAG: murein L,D-transpeptidase [Candidatus Methylumidiphilus sp.]